MAQPIWKGHLSFGLVSIPVSLHSAERRVDLSFHLVDSRNSARVRYERINEETGEEVPWEKIVKGFEYKDGSYVLLSEAELKKASVERTRTVEIERFVDLGEIDIHYYERPYYLVPEKGGDKGYVLMREALAESGKAGLARIVIRAREYLAALLPRGKALVLNLLRFPQELRPDKDIDIPRGDLKKYRITRKEIDLAQRLIEGMSGEFKASELHDDYREALLKLIQRKIKAGKTKVIVSEEEEKEEPTSAPIDFLQALQKSIARTKRSGGAERRAAKKPAKRSQRKKAG